MSILGGNPAHEDGRGVPGILGMNVPNDLSHIFSGKEGAQQMA